MIRTPAFRSLLALAALFCLPLIAAATTLQAKVVAVESGNTLVVNTINRPLRIKLKAVAPPESGQPFNDKAREHLRALILDKIVSIDYTHLADGYLSAKVISDGIDIGSMMLRDGFAWYDRAADHALRDSDRELYAQCEQTARGEKRGLWEDPAPVAPWEFREIQLARLNGVSSETSFRQSQARKQRASGSLSNDDLLGAMAGPGSSAGQPSFRRISAAGIAGHWTRYESVSEHFSVSFPSDGVEATYSVPDASGNPLPVHYLAAGNEQAKYLLLSSQAPTGKYTDASANDETARGFVAGLNHGFERNGLSVTITIKPLRDLKLDGYTGRQYSLHSEALSGVVRAYSKQVGGQRVFYMLCVLTRPGSGFVDDQFLNSFRISGR
jgi:endonuclease YncB( thermonuclease family)